MFSIHSICVYTMKGRHCLFDLQKRIENKGESVMKVGLRFEMNYVGNGSFESFTVFSRTDFEKKSTKISKNGSF